MATIRRHSVPPDSFKPDAPLNDLVRKQLEHFIHVAEGLPPKLRPDMPIPSADDSVAANRFIAAVTERLLSRKRSPLTLVGKRPRKPASTGVSIAAGAEAPHPKRAKRNPKAEAKPKSKSQSKSKSKTRKHPTKKSSGA
jgi:hypothetical protein